MVLGIVRTLGQLIIAFFVIMALMTTALDLAGRFGWIPDLGYQNFAINLVAWLVGLGLLLIYIGLAIVEIPFGFLGIDVVSYYHFDLGTLGIMVLEAILVLFIFVGLTTIEAMILIPEFVVFFVIIFPLDSLMGFEVEGLSLNDVPILSEIWNGWTLGWDEYTRIHIPGLKSILGLHIESKPAIITVLTFNFQQTLNVWGLIIELINAILGFFGFTTEFLGELQDEVGIVFVLDMFRALGFEVQTLEELFQSWS